MRGMGLSSDAMPVWRALGAMMVVGTIALVLLGQVFQLAAPVGMDHWSVLAAYAAALLLGLRLAPPTARAVAHGDWIFGPLLGGILYVAGVLAGGLVHGLLEGVTPETALADVGIPVIGFLVVGTIPAFLVGGVFSLVLIPVRVSRPVESAPPLEALPRRAAGTGDPEAAVEEDSRPDFFRVR